LQGSIDLTAELNTSVTTRAVFLIGGYERNDARRFFVRIAKELQRFAACWSVRAEISDPVFDDAGHMATARISYRDDSASCQTDFTFLSFDDIVKTDGARPFIVRLTVYLAGFFDYVFSGTMFRFFAANWRFALYFLYPFVSLCFFAFAGWMVYRLALILGLPGGPVLPALLGIAAALGVGRYLGTRYFVYHLMDLWSFSREHLRGRRQDIEGHYALWAERIAERIGEKQYDEVLLVGHSTGGALILDLAAVLAEKLRQEGRPVDFSLMTVGSTSLKVALHPAAKKARQRLASLAGYPNIRWTEFQALTDIINFYKCDPYRMAGLQHKRSDAFPRMFQVRFKGMLDAKQYKRIKRNFFRVHYQFISANNRPYFFDFFMVTCGPLRLSSVSEKGKRDNGAGAGRREVA
jgi:hypothetical protein